MEKKVFYMKDEKEKEKIYNKNIINIIYYYKNNDIILNNRINIKIFLYKIKIQNNKTIFIINIIFISFYYLFFDFLFGIIINILIIFFLIFIIYC